MRKKPDIAEVKSSDRMYTNVTRVRRDAVTVMRDAKEKSGIGFYSDDTQDSITIGRHELTPYRDVSIVDADYLERIDDDQRIHRYGQKGLPCILHMRADWEGLREAATPIDHLWNKKRELIQTHAEKAAELFQYTELFLYNMELGTECQYPSMDTYYFARCCTFAAVYIVLFYYALLPQTPH
ncbi:hypothetical protein scyTo_0001807 [Scyliorhinus torazame]|uniref:Uncharacterized protein n=1 Tax=Scyliorhinus torazame TaxID=75743 RepID=A0A401PG13_SCYTO|nr:hypothetical protein [Scyliorhinus torazame]